MQVEFAETLALLRAEYEDHGTECNCPVHYLIAGIDRVRVDLRKHASGQCSAEQAIASILKKLGAGAPRE